ncbi:MAG: (deoxy)nucleoside triphosphate pyrophosphohydrolase [Acidobacteria bacterium]|nr:(deoxy)nucleoside triphosphate pyrophosphohydrolase [Acidobacteriota bacterium]
MTVVVAAIIERAGQVLICQRAAGQPHAGKWEFPGGKVEPEESYATALARELREELDIEANIAGEVTRYPYQYPGRAPILLVFYLVTEFAGEPRNRVFERICWEHARNLPSYDFLAGDVEFVKRLAAGES